MQFTVNIMTVKSRSLARPVISGTLGHRRWMDGWMEGRKEGMKKEMKKEIKNERKKERKIDRKKEGKEYEDGMEGKKQ